MAGHRLRPTRAMSAIVSTRRWKVALSITSTAPAGRFGIRSRSSQRLKMSESMLLAVNPTPRKAPARSTPIAAPRPRAFHFAPQNNGLHAAQNRGGAACPSQSRFHQGKRWAAQRPHAPRPSGGRLSGVRSPSSGDAGFHASRSVCATSARSTSGTARTRRRVRIGRRPGDRERPGQVSPGRSCVFSGVHKALDAGASTSV